MKLMRQATIAAALLLSVATAQAQTQPGIQNPKVLLPQAQFERLAVLDAWRSNEPWMRGAFKVEKEGDQTFLRVSQPPARITTTAAVPIGAKEIALSFKVRSTGIEPGQKEWDVPIVSITFFDRFGNEVADGWKAGWRFRDNMPQWQNMARRYTLPPGARVAQIEIAHKPTKGTFDIADIKLFDPANAPTGVGLAALGAPLDVSKQLDEKAKNSGFPILDPKRGLGADVNEKNVQVTLHVNPNAKAGGNGTQATPLNSLVQAVDTARTHLNEGRGVRIALQPGVYRLTQEKQMLRNNLGNAALDLTNWTPKGRDAVLVIEGVGGQAILSGAEEWEPQQWELVDKAKRIYRASWKENWGFHHAGYYRWNNIRQHRRELVALNGKPMELAMLEDFSYTDPKGRVYDSVGNVISENKDAKKEAYTYIGWKGAEVLQPGQFGVAERDDHPGGDSIYLRLPENMTSLDGATVEVGKARTIMMVNGKNNFVMRNLTFQHAASHYNDYFGKAAFDTGDYLTPKDMRDWVIENCVFRHNNGLGLRFFYVSNLDVRDVRAEYNGAMGIDTAEIRKARYTNVEVLHNNHRARPANYYGHGGGGMSFSGEDAVFTDCKFNNNYGFGFREDVFGQRIQHIRNQFNNNTEGVFYEISWGPVLFKDSQVIGNQKRGLFLLNVYNVTVANCQIQDNGLGLAFYQSPTRETPLELTSAYTGHEGVPIQMVRNFLIKNSTITGTKPEHKLVGRELGVGSLDHQHIFFREEYSGENNRFYNPSSTEMFDLSRDYSKEIFHDWAAWKQASGEKATSYWGPKRS